MREVRSHTGYVPLGETEQQPEQVLPKRPAADAMLLPGPALYQLTKSHQVDGKLLRPAHLIRRAEAEGFDLTPHIESYAPERYDHRAVRFTKEGRRLVESDRRKKTILGAVKHAFRATRIGTPFADVLDVGYFEPRDYKKLRPFVLTPRINAAIVAMRKDGKSESDVAEYFGVPGQYIRDCVKSAEKQPHGDVRLKG